MVCVSVERVLPQAQSGVCNEFCGREKWLVACLKC
jgi:hypothetical protein